MTDAIDHQKFLAMWNLDSALCDFLNLVTDPAPLRVWELSIKKRYDILCEAYNEATKAGCFPDKLKDEEYYALLSTGDVVLASNIIPKQGSAAFAHFTASAPQTPPPSPLPRSGSTASE